MNGLQTRAVRSLLWLLAVLAAVSFPWLYWHKGGTSGKRLFAEAHGGTVDSTNAPRPSITIKPSNIPEPLTLIKTSRVISDLVVTNSAAPIGATGISASAARVLEMQVALVRQGISPGSLDGVMGAQTRAALRAFQQKAALPVTGELDEESRLQLFSSVQILTNYVVTSHDLLRLLPLGKTWLAKSQQDRLDYETILELIAEASLSSPNLIRRLNPGTSWSNVVAGETIKIPLVEVPPVQAKAGFVKICLADRVLQAFDETNNLLAHFPCSIAQRVEKRPAGELHVAALALNPNYTFDPEVFPESAEAQELGRKLVLQPGPNNPVGTVWIGLDKPGYGIHGTPQPEQVGRTESHGCFRLANWNAEYLLKLVWIGMPVFVEP